MEADILLWIQDNVRTDWLTPIVKSITYLGNGGIIWILLAVAFLFFEKYRRVGYMCATALVTDLLSVNLILKTFIRRARPYEMIEGLTNLIGEQSDFSFPSGHTAASFAVATVLLLRCPKKISIPGLILAILISLSRLYVGVHYPTDILGGVVVGILCGLVGVYYYEWGEKAFSKEKKEAQKKEETKK